MVSGKLLALTGAALIAAATTAADAVSVYSFNSTTGGLSWSTSGFDATGTLIDLTGLSGTGLSSYAGTTFTFSGFTAASAVTGAAGSYTQELSGGTITITSAAPSSTLLTSATVTLGGMIITVGPTGHAYFSGAVTSFSGDPSFLGLYTAPGSFGFDVSGITATTSGSYLVLSSTAVGGTITASEPGDTSSVPLPAAAWGGLSLLGSMGAMRALRRRALKA